LRGCACLKAVRDRYAEPNSVGHIGSKTVALVGLFLQIRGRGSALRALTDKFHRHANGNTANTRPTPLADVAVHDSLKGVGVGLDGGHQGELGPAAVEVVAGSACLVVAVAF
jgi:hypothetical protein